MSNVIHKRKILLHIGWPKTGTSTLQKHALNKIDGYRYLGKIPFQGGKNALCFNIVHLLAYAAIEKFHSTHEKVFSEMIALERSLYQNVDRSIPLIISEEGILSCLLKPSDHQHHGYSTASLSQIVARAKLLQELWNVSFEFLITERDQFEMLHAYYAQAHHIFKRFPGLGTFQRYISTGVQDLPGKDLGFRYLKDGLVIQAFKDGFGAEKVFNISMEQLFRPGQIHLELLHPELPCMQFRDSEIENKRSIAKNVKVTHARPAWVKKKPFKLSEFLRNVKLLYMQEYADHKKLEIMIVADERQERDLLDYLNERPKSGPVD